MVQETQGATRRTLMKGIAWAAPMATIAVAVPALAVSPPIVVTLSATSCKETRSSKRYYLAFSIRNTGSGIAEVRAISLSVAANSGQMVTFSGGLPTAWEPVGGHDAILLDYTSTKNGNISQGTATATFEVRDPSGVVQTVTETFDIGSLPPCECVPAPCEETTAPAAKEAAADPEADVPEEDAAPEEDGRSGEEQRAEEVEEPAEPEESTPETPEPEQEAVEQSAPEEEEPAAEPEASDGGGEETARSSASDGGRG